jgi:hypothetical protein
MEQLELEKQAAGSNQSSSELVTKIKQLEDELKVANEVARRLQTESESQTSKKKAPTLGKIGKSTSDGGKVSRESLTRGGSQEDPVQLLRDLQDSAERETDLREQLRFAEEEVSRLWSQISSTFINNPRSFCTTFASQRTSESLTLKSSTFDHTQNTFPFQALKLNL